MCITPMRIEGPWDAGYVLDWHIIRSVPLGEDVYGHMQFDTTRSALGELLYQVKYQHNYAKLDELMKLIIPFLDDWAELRQVSYVIPAPSSKRREVQPVNLLAERIAKHLHVGWSAEILEKTTIGELKGSSPVEKEKLVQGNIKKRLNAKLEHTMLLVDDLYESGATVRACVRALRKDPKIKGIYVLCLTRVKQKG